MSAYFTRGTGHDENARYSEDADVYLRNMERLKHKYETAKKYVPAPVLHTNKKATVGILAYGSTENAIFEAQHQLATEHGLQTELMRLRAIPFTDEVTKFIEKYDQVFVVEMNRKAEGKAQKKAPAKKTASKAKPAPKKKAAVKSTKKTIAKSKSSAKSKRK